MDPLAEISDLARALYYLSLTDDSRENVETSTASSIEVPQALDDTSSSMVGLKMLQEAGVLDERFRIVTSGAVVASTTDAQKAYKELLDSKLVFRFEDSYTLCIPYLELLKRFSVHRNKFKAPLAGFHIVGSGVAKIAGRSWFLEYLRSLCPRPDFAQLLETIDASHIEQDTDDIDTHIDASGILPPGCQELQMLLVQMLFAMHHEKVTIKQTHTDGTALVFNGFYQFLTSNAHIGLLKHVSSIKVECPDIPWLQGCTISYEDLLTIRATLVRVKFADMLPAKKFDDVQCIVSDLACTFLFRRSFQEMCDYITKDSHAFILFHNFAKSETFRITCRDTRGQQHDIVILKQPQAPAYVVAFQNLTLDIQPAVTGRDERVHLTASPQAVVDKAFRLIEWLDTENADQSDWALFWFLVAKKYVSVLPDTQKALQEKFLQYCSRKESYAKAFAETISYKLTSRSKYDPSHNFAFIFAALSDLPEKEFPECERVKIWPLVHEHFKGLDFPWNCMQAPLQTHVLEYKMAKLLLKRLCYLYLMQCDQARKKALFRACITEHNGVKSVQFEMAKACFTFTFQPEKDFEEYAALLRRQSKEAKDAIHSIQASLGIENLGEVRAGSVFAPMDTSLLLDSQDPDVCSDAIQLSRLNYSLQPRDDILLALLRHVPHLFTNISDDGRLALSAFLLKELESRFQLMSVCCSQLREHFKRLLQEPNPICSHIECLLSIQCDQVNTLAGQMIKEQSHASGLALALRLIPVRIHSAVKVCTALRDIPGPIFEEWEPLLTQFPRQMAKERNDVRFFQLAKAYIDIVAWCTSQWPDKVDILKGVVNEAVLFLFSQGASGRAIQFVAMSTGKKSTHPLAIAARQYLALKTATQPPVAEVYQTLQKLAEGCPDRLHCHFLVELAASLAPNASVDACLTSALCRTSGLDEAVPMMLTFVLRGLPLNAAAVWTDYVQKLFQGSPVTIARTVYTRSQELNISNLDCEMRYIALLITNLYRSDEADRQLGDRLFAGSWREMRAGLAPATYEVAEQRQKGARLVELESDITDANAVSRLKQILQIIDLTDSQNAEKMRSLCKQWLGVYRPDAVQLLEQDRVQSLFQEQTSEFLKLCIAALHPSGDSRQEKLVKVIITYVTRFAATQDTPTLHALIERLLENDFIEQAIDILILLECKDLFPWSCALKTAGTRGTLACKTKAHDAVRCLEGLDVESSMWHTIEMWSLDIASELYCKLKEKAYLDRVLAILRKMQHQDSSRLGSSLVGVLGHLETDRTPLPEELSAEIAACRTRVMEAGSHPDMLSSLDSLYVQVMCHSRDYREFYDAFQLFYNQVRGADITTPHCELFFTYVKRAKLFERDALPSDLRELIEKMMAFLEPHIEKLTDSLPLIGALLQFRESLFFQHILPIATRRPAAHPANGSPAWKEQAQNYTLIIHKLIDLCDDNSLKLANHLIKTIPLGAQKQQELKRETELAEQVIQICRSPSMKAACQQATEYLFGSVADHFTPLESLGSVLPRQTAFYSWFMQRQKADKLIAVSPSSILSSFMTSFSAYLFEHSEETKDVIPQEIERHFADVVMKKLHDQTLQICIPSKDKTKERAQALNSLLGRLILCPLGDTSVKVVMLFFTWSQISKMLDARHLDAGALFSLTELFICHERGESWQDFSTFHTRLSLLLLKKLVTLPFSNEYNERLAYLFLRSGGIFCEGDGLTQERRAGLALKAARTLFSHSDSFLQAIGCQIVSTCSEHNIIFEIKTLCTWFTTALQRLKMKTQYSQFDLQLLLKICAYDPGAYRDLVTNGPDPLECYRPVLELKLDILFRLALAESSNETIVFLVFEIFQSSIRNQYMRPDVAASLDRLQTWVAHVLKYYPHTPDKWLAFATRITNIFVELYTSAASDEASKAQWREMFRRWYNALGANSDPVSCAVNNWMLAKAQTMPESFKKSLEGATPRLPFPKAEASVNSEMDQLSKDE